MDHTDLPLTVIYNDTCPICAREVAAYAARARRHGVPLTLQGLDSPRCGLDRDRAARRFHVVEGDRLHDGVDAFALLWSRLPGLGWLAWLVTRRPVAPLARSVYDRLLAPTLYALHRRRAARGPRRWTAPRS